MMTEARLTHLVAAELLLLGRAAAVCGCELSTGVTY